MVWWWWRCSTAAAAADAGAGQGRRLEAPAASRLAAPQARAPIRSIDRRSSNGGGIGAVGSVAIEPLSCAAHTITLLWLPRHSTIEWRKVKIAHAFVMDHVLL
jgi:hypothetical protein